MDRVLEGINGSNRYLQSRNHTPLEWVNVQWSNSIYNRNCEDLEIKNYYDGKYFAHRSFFWNVTYKLICDYYEIKRNSFEWSKKLVWSNLVFGNSMNSPFEYIKKHYSLKVTDMIESGHGNWKCLACKGIIEDKERMLFGVPHLSRYFITYHPEVISWVKSYIDK